MVALAGESAKDWDAQLKVEARVKGRLAAPELSATVDFAQLGAGGIKLGAGRAEARLVGDKVVVDRLTLPFGGGTLKASGEVKLAAERPHRGDRAARRRRPGRDPGAALGAGGLGHRADDRDRTRLRARLASRRSR